MKHIKHPKRDPIKSYFPLPNEVFSLGLTTGEIAVYAYLMFCEDRYTHQCYPSYKTIGRAVDMSKNTVMKHVAGLEEKGLITTEPTTIYDKNGNTCNGNLLYTIRPIHEAVEVFYKRQQRKLEKDIAKAQLEKMLEEQETSSPVAS